MAQDFQTGGTHTPNVAANIGDGTVIPIDVGYPSLYGPDLTKVTLLNNSPMNSKADVDPL